MIACLSLFLCVRCAVPDELILASTTSTVDSGLLDVLIPAFERTHGDVRVKVVGVGSGEAMALGRRGDADVLLVHSPTDEEAFMREGFGVRRLPVMVNDFVIVGAATDPAGLRGMRDAVEAMRTIAAQRAPFISRGDNSGTHRRELDLWAEAGLSTDAAARVEAGQGMGEVLMIASERSAYTLTDRGTWLALRDALRLDVLVEGDPRLLNPYSVVTVRGTRRRDAADAFADWLTSAAASALIDGFGRDRLGEPLFEATRR